MARPTALTFADPSLNSLVLGKVHPHPGIFKMRQDRQDGLPVSQDWAAEGET